MQSLLLPPFAAAAARTAPVAPSRSAIDHGTFARELESRIVGSRDRQRASPSDESTPDDVTPSDGRDARPDRLTTDRAASHDDAEPPPIDAPPEPSADAPDGAPSSETTPESPNDSGTSGGPIDALPGVIPPFNLTASASPSDAAPSQVVAASVAVDSATPAKDRAPTTSVAVTRPAQPFAAAEASSFIAPSSAEAGLSNSSGENGQNATTQAVAAGLVSAGSGRTPSQREEQRSAIEIARASGSAPSSSVRIEPVVSPLEPLRATPVEESRTVGPVDGTSAGQDESAPTPNPATQLARVLVELAGGTTRAPAPDVPTEVGTTSAAPALSPGVVAVADPSVAAPPVTPAPVAPSNPVTSDVAVVAPSPTTDSQAPLQDVVTFVAGTVGSRNAHVRMQLDPPDLGAMRIDIRTQQQALSVRIEVETADALARIQSGVVQLRQSLEQHGLVVDRFDVQLRPTDSASPHADGSDARDDRLADPHSSFERDRPENETAEGKEASSARPGDDDDAIEEAARVETDRESRPSTLTAASVDVWA